MGVTHRDISVSSFETEEGLVKHILTTDFEAVIGVHSQVPRSSALAGHLFLIAREDLDGV